MKKHIVFIALFIQALVYAQSTSKWSVGLEYSFNDLSYSNSNNYVELNPGLGYNASFDQTNYTAGFVVNYQQNTQLSFSSGLLYSNNDFTGGLNCPACLLVNDTPIEIKQRFLSIPMIGKYQLAQGNLVPYVEAGLHNNISIQSDLDQIANFYFLEASIGGSVYYQLSEKWKFGIGYRYRTSLTNVYSSDSVKLRTSQFFAQLITQL